VSLAKQEQQIAELDREIDRLQRTEEAIVVATGAPALAVSVARGAAGRQGRREGPTRSLINEGVGCPPRLGKARGRLAPLATGVVAKSP
jgi:hypothetical protein